MAIAWDFDSTHISLAPKSVINLCFSTRRPQFNSCWIMKKCLSSSFFYNSSSALTEYPILYFQNSLGKTSVYWYACSLETIKGYYPLFTSGDSKTQKGEVILYMPEVSKRKSQLKTAGSWKTSLAVYNTPPATKNAVFLNFVGRFQEKGWPEAILQITRANFRDCMQNLVLEHTAQVLVTILHM